MIVQEALPRILAEMPSHKRIDEFRGRQLNRVKPCDFGESLLPLNHFPRRQLWGKVGLARGGRTGYSLA